MVKRSLSDRIIIWAIQLGLWMGLLSAWHVEISKIGWPNFILGCICFVGYGLMSEADH